MKRVIYLLIALLFCLRLSAQKDFIYGTVRADAYKEITKGAFWGIRPEAKMVYNNEYPDGIEVKILESDYFVRFIDSEHNNFDRNYIILPKGERIYQKNGCWYAAVCGNQIDYFSPVDGTIVVKPSAGFTGNVTGLGEKDLKFRAPTNLEADFKKAEMVEDYRPTIPIDQSNKKAFNWKPLIIGGVTVVTGTLATIMYFVIKKANQAPVVIVVTIPSDSGGPVGAPGHGDN